MQPKNIVEAYKIAVLSAEMQPTAKKQVFENVIDFCEKDASCSTEPSVKRDTLLFWAYNHLAQEKEKNKDYLAAVVLWQKAYPLMRSPKAQIRLGLKMLKALEREGLPLSEKAKQIVATTQLLEKAYLQSGNSKEVEHMKRLRQTAEYVLGKPFC